MRVKTLISAMVLGSLGSTAALAQSQGDYRAPWRGDFWGYAGASAGESKFDAECDRLIVSRCDKRDTGFKVYAGGRFNEVFGMEVGYTDFGRISASGGQIEAWAIPVTLTAGIPLSNRFGVVGKVGGVYARTDVDVGPTSLFERGHKDGWGWTYGVGATFAFTQTLQARVDLDRYKLDFVGGRRDVDMLSAGLQMRF